MSWADGKDYIMKCQICEDLESSLQDFVDRELDEISRQRLSMHLNACAEFQQRLEEYQFLKVSAASLDSNKELDLGIRSRLRANLTKELGLKNKL
jgi:anti-sigma factor RsiW